MEAVVVYLDASLYGLTNGAGITILRRISWHGRKECTTDDLLVDICKANDFAGWDVQKKDDLEPRIFPPFSPAQKQPLRCSYPSTTD
ncbi:hypothetical protein CEXT_615651 [Caerostris extrusa]|uniref:Uncharacterized protein n=1 Tax=Caerostris extrusa TaxID=172846 RepID=A0AAV4SEB5_CAEEX|nr:hypothetical protein CEXT_615651 [Caerostris extrusa]